MFAKGILVRHLDGNSLNNKASNLALGTNSDNMLDKSKEDRVAHAKHAASFLVKYPWDRIKADRKSGMTYKELMSKYSIKSKGTLSYKLGKRK